MSNNVGLSTPRGSGTSGYVQRNLAYIKPRNYGAPYTKDPDTMRHKQRQSDQGILEHHRKRQVEVKVLELRDELEEEELDQDEIGHRCEELRAKLLADMEMGRRSGPSGPKKQFKGYPRDEHQAKEQGTKQSIYRHPVF